MKSFEERVAEDRRLALLRGLERSINYESNDSLLTMVARDCGHAVSRDRVRADLIWLKEQGLVIVEQISDAWIVTLTQPGLDCVSGDVVVPGIKWPSRQS